jgi:hypothetical protein
MFGGLELDQVKCEAGCPPPRAMMRPLRVGTPCRLPRNNEIARRSNENRRYVPAGWALTCYMNAKGVGMWRVGAVQL